MSNNIFTLIAGPCAIESWECLQEIAKNMKGIADRLNVEYYFKASFDKANRTSIDAYRGPGIDKGLEMLQNIKDMYGLKIATDVHESWQVQPVAEVADIIQIPAFLCRQTDLLIAAAKTGKIVNVKKAQFLAPWDMQNVIRKLESAGPAKILLCERGTAFGYNTLVVDMTSIPEMKMFGYPVIFDATHSVQKPGGKGTYTDGNRKFVAPLAKAAVSVGADGVYLEVHPDPDNAKSDGPNMIPLSEVDRLLTSLVRLYHFMEEDV